MNLLEILDRPIAFHRSFVALGIGINGALMLSQLCYWSNKAKKADGWLYKSREEWQEETGLTRFEQEGARRALRIKGLLQESKRGVPCRLWYRVNVAELERQLAAAVPVDNSQLAGFPPTGQTSQPVGGKPANKVAGNQQPSTETTNTASLLITQRDISCAKAPEQKTTNRPPQRRRAGQALIPDDWLPNEQERADAIALGVPEHAVDWETGQFRDKQLSTGKTSANWGSEWRSWCRVAVGMKYPQSVASTSNPEKQGHSGTKKLTSDEIESRRQASDYGIALLEQHGFRTRTKST